MKYVLVSVAAILLVVACSRRDPALLAEAQAFLDQYSCENDVIVAGADRTV